jgi:hypothetical protein
LKIAALNKNKELWMFALIWLNKLRKNKQKCL